MAKTRAAAAAKRIRTGVGKAGPMAQVVHRKADLHAVANQDITGKSAPRTERELAKYLRDEAEIVRDEVRNSLRRAAVDGRLRQASGLADLEGELNDMVREYERLMRDTAAEATRAAYAGGKASAMFMLDDTIGVDFPVSFSRPDRAAMAALANDLFTDLAGQTENMSTAAVEILRTVAGRVLQEQLARGMNVVDAARALERELTAQGYSPDKALAALNAALGRNPENAARGGGLMTLQQAAQFVAEDGALQFVDKAGRRWDLRDYCEMAAKTKLFIARNEAAVATMAGADVNHWRANVTAFECDYCDPYEGEIYWTGRGDAQGYSVCPLGLPPWHPNCEHYVIPEVLVARR